MVLLILAVIKSKQTGGSIGEKKKERVLWLGRAVAAVGDTGVHLPIPQGRHTAVFRHIGQAVPEVPAGRPAVRQGCHEAAAGHRPIIMEDTVVRLLYIIIMGAEGIIRVMEDIPTEEVTRGCACQSCYPLSLLSW